MRVIVLLILTNSPQGRINNLKLEMVMDIVEEMRGFESDHEPDGWPAIQMKHVSALCDEIDALRAELQKLREQEPVIQIENDRVINFNPNYDGDVSNGEFYAAPVPAMPIPKQEPAGAVHDFVSDKTPEEVMAILDFKSSDRDLWEEHYSSLPSPRITEQDAREIVTAWVKHLDDHDETVAIHDFEWSHHEWKLILRTLLNKLNANAVATQAAAIPGIKND